MSNTWPAYNHTPIWEQPKPPRTLQNALLDWDNAKRNLAEAKELEMQFRREAFALGFAEAKEGTNTTELANGYELKGVKKLNYNLKAPENYVGTTVDAVNDCCDAFAALSNEGSFVAERIFKWSVDLSITEYRKLVEEATYSPVKKKMLTELEKVLVITEAAPTLEICEAKKKK